jgi:hypothetical protein
MTADVVLERIYQRTGKIPRGSDTQRVSLCTSHEDRNPSLSIRLEADKVLLHCHAGCSVEDILASLDLTPADLFNQPLERTERPADDTWIPCQERGHRRVAQYPYKDERGTVVHGVTRCDHKCFAQWRPDDSTRSGRRWSLNGPDGKRLVRTVPYLLPEALKAKAEDRVIWIAEGEKDVHALIGRGLIATCNAGGAGKWTAAHAAFLEGADITICADRDDPGRKHAEAVVESLFSIAKSIYVVQAKTGKDAADHFAAGHNDSEFVQVWAPKPYPGDPIGAQ